MKIALIIAVSLLSQIGFAWVASADAFVLVKTLTPGVGPDLDGPSVECKIYRDRVEVLRRIGSVSASERRMIGVDGNMIELINSAALGKILSSPGSEFLPTTSYVALQRFDGGMRRVELSTYGSQIIRNDAAASRALARFADSVCGQL